MELKIADLIIQNARIYDPVKGFLPESALAIFKNRILAIGTDSQVLSLKDPACEIINAGGRWLLPAFCDAHTHFLMLVKRRQEIRLGECKSLAETLEKVKRKVDEIPEGGWITGGGWNRNIWGESEFPDRRQLDRISTRHFIALDSKDWHTMWVNTPVLELAKIPVDKVYPGARHFALNSETGEFTGVLEESRRLAVFDLIPKAEFRQLRPAYQKVVQEFHRLGFGSIHSVETTEEFAAYQQAGKNSEPGLRISWYLPYKNLSAARELKLAADFGDDFLRVSGVKMFVDGAFGSQTAEVTEPYLELGHSGVEVLTQEELNEMVRETVDAGLSCAVHAIGDRAIRKTLHAFGNVNEESRRRNLRHRIEHAQLIHPDDYELFAKYEVFASVQPVHLAADIPIIEKYLGERGKNAYPYSTLQKHGVPLLFGSDTPVEPFNPWLAIFTAMQRRPDLEMDAPVFYPEQRLSLESCLTAYTLNPAVSVGCENRLGRIATGYLADLTVLNQDVFSVEAEPLKETESALTIVDGKPVYRTI